MAATPANLNTQTMSNETAEAIIKEFEMIRAGRGTWENHCEEVAARVQPESVGLFTGFGNSQRTEGQKRTEELYDCTAAINADRAAAIMDSLLTPRNGTWQKVKPSDPYLLKDRQTLLYFEEVTRVLFQHRYAPLANFATQNNGVFCSQINFGSGCMFTDKIVMPGNPRARGLRYKNVHISEIYPSENHQGIVDKVYRFFTLKPRQAIQKWGKDKVPAKILDAAQRSPDQDFFFLHCVKPRENYDKERLDAKGMPFASYYISMEGKVLLEEGGYTSFPYSVPRYKKAAREVFGRGPIMLVLPAIKTLNEQKKSILKQAHRVLDPIYLMFDDGVMDVFGAKPGTMVPGGVSPDGRPLVHALQTGNIAIGKELMDDERADIKDVCFINLFQILADNPQMTATEVLERTKEKGILMAPAFGGQDTEYLGPNTHRELDLLALQGLLPPMPPALREAQGQYTLEHDSPFTRAQRAEEAAGFMRSVEQTLEIVNVTQDKSLLNIYSFKRAMPAIAEIQGVPHKWMSSPEEIAAYEEAQVDEADTQTMIQGAPAAAAMVKAVAASKKGK